VLFSCVAEEWRGGVNAAACRGASLTSLASAAVFVLAATADATDGARDVRLVADAPATEFPPLALVFGTYSHSTASK
jgi:hypothetical protein